MVLKKKPQAEKEKEKEHDCEMYADTKWRLTTGEDWEPVIDYCQICGKVLHEY
jgi:hypothetical protein